MFDQYNLAKRDESETLIRKFMRYVSSTSNESVRLDFFFDLVQIMFYFHSFSSFKSAFFYFSFIYIFFYFYFLLPRSTFQERYFKMSSLNLGMNTDKKPYERKEVLDISPLFKSARPRDARVSQVLDQTAPRSLFLKA